ncbi:septal ring factor EnvC (AmiA/AmiB activator) [Rhodopirellula rubra]|uniref:Septal ring factor EnvC (AmiA/AmiB activator) n=1 Tax=Aporhodopirellula rubra TaxID=980271 RepID=A0A7W5E2X3_9BACT|nr:hypothetical protein [Aporhodopirellula rubra]MBB3208603.1 septal ring factor EnvC (AmiA/AmiB activator) [Aporhodopirellula rubra]
MFRFITFSFALACSTSLLATERPNDALAELAEVKRAIAKLKCRIEQLEDAVARTTDCASEIEFQQLRIVVADYASRAQAREAIARMGRAAYFSGSLSPDTGWERITATANAH